MHRIRTSKGISLLGLSESHPYSDFQRQFPAWTVRITRTINDYFLLFLKSTLNRSILNFLFKLHPTPPSPNRTKARMFRKNRIS